VLDTNFLIEAEKRRVLDDARAALPGAKLVTLSPVMAELEKQGHKLALEIVKKESIDVLPAKGYADDAIAEYAAAHKSAVATNDKALTERLRAKGIGVLYPKNRGCGFLGAAE